MMDVAKTSNTSVGTLDRVVRAAAWRMTVNRSLRAALLFAAGVVALVALCLRGLWGILDLPSAMLLLPVPVVAVVWAWQWIARRVRPESAAFALDQSLRTRELFGSAWECPANNPFSSWLRNEAEARAAQVDLNEAMPLSFPISALPFAASVLLLAGSVLGAPPSAREDAAAGQLRRSGQRLRETAAVTTDARLRELISDAHLAGQHYEEGIQPASVQDTRDLKERFETALADEEFRRRLLEALSEFVDVRDIEVAAAEGSGEQIRLAIEGLDDALRGVDPKKMRDTLADLGDTGETVKTLVLKLEEGGDAFAEAVKAALAPLMTNDDLAAVKQVKAALTAVERDAEALAAVGSKGTPAAVHDRRADSGGSVARPDDEADSVETFDPAAGLGAPEQWTSAHWQAYAATARESTIDLHPEEKQILTRYFTRD